MSRKMTPEEIRVFLSHGTRTAKVATSGPGGQPHVMPVWFVLDGRELVFTTRGDSVKGRNLRRNAVPGELLVRLRPARVIATAGVAG